MSDPEYNSPLKIILLRHKKTPESLKDVYKELPPELLKLVETRALIEEHNREQERSKNLPVTKTKSYLVPNKLALFPAISNEEDCLPANEKSGNTTVTYGEYLAHSAVIAPSPAVSALADMHARYKKEGANEAAAAKLIKEEKAHLDKLFDPEEFPRNEIEGFLKREYPEKKPELSNLESLIPATLKESLAALAPLPDLNVALPARLRPSGKGQGKFG